MLHLGIEFEDDDERIRKVLGNLSEADVDLESMTETRRVNGHMIRRLDIEGLITLKEEGSGPITCW